MKTGYFGLTLLFILLVGVIQSSTASQLTAVDLQTGQSNNDGSSTGKSEDLSFDVEIETQPLEDLSKFGGSSFDQISPLVVNNVTATRKTTLVEDDALQINIDLEKQTIPSGLPLHFSIQATRGLAPAVGTKFWLEIIEGEHWGYYYWWAEEYYGYQDRILEAQQITIGADGEYYGVFYPPQDGVFSLVVRDLSTNVLQTRTFTVADLGIFWRVPWEYVKNEEHYSVAYVVNTTDFSPIPNATVELSTIKYEYDPDYTDYLVTTETVFTGVTDGSGVAEITFVPPANLSTGYLLANLSATHEGKSVYVSRDLRQGDNRWWWGDYQTYEPYEFIITTDKPIYTPGESIQARVLLWKNDYHKVTKTPLQSDFKLKLLSPSQHILVQREIVTDAYGVATYSFSLDSEAELGKYQLVTQIRETQASHELRVDRYEKPAFRVNILTDRDYVPPGHMLTGVLNAEYYFGKPVVNGEIELTVGGLTTLSTLTGVTDSKGDWEFEYQLPDESHLEGLQSIELNATVTDTVGRKVESSIEVQVSELLYVWAYINPWFPKVNENITVYFGAFQQSDDYRYGWWRYTPLPEATVRLKLYSLSSFGTPYYFTTLQGETDENGQGNFNFQIPISILRYYSNFRGTIEVDPGDGRKASTNVYFSVNRNFVDIALSADVYSQEEFVEFTATIVNGITQDTIKGTVQIRLFDPDYDLIGSLTTELDSDEKILRFPLSKYAPRGKYYIHTYLETRVKDGWWFWTYYSYQGTVEFSVGTEVQSVDLTVDQTEYALTEQIQLTGSVQGTTNAPVMVQLVKRGIVQTEFIPKTTASSFSLEIDDAGTLAPRFWAFVFVILSDGTILENYLEVKIDTTLNVEFQTDQEVYQPGDQATLDIRIYDAIDNPITTLAALSFVDSSVFGVEPDPETERSSFEDSQYWPSVSTAVSWKNRQHFWWFWWYEGDGLFSSDFSLGGEVIAAQDVGIEKMSAPSANVGGTTDLSTSDIKIRDYLPENAYWNPELIMEDGKWTLQLVLPDTIGEWTIRTVVTTVTGQGVLAKTTLKTFIPFFVDLDKPPQVLQDDVFVLKGVVYNYLDETVDIQVKIETAKGLLLLGHPDQRLRLPPGFLGAISWTSLALEIGNQNVTLYASTTLTNRSIFADAIRKPISVKPNGISQEVRTSGFISNGVMINYTRYEETIQATEFLEISLGLGSVAINSWERLIGYPYGCTEQTISRIIPDALVYRYLNSTGELRNETEALLRDMIISGLSRLYSQRHPDGGWGWWSSDSSRVYMTSIVLHGLSEVNRTGIYTDLNVIAKALTFIIDQQNQDGSWNPDSWSRIDQGAFTAFVLRSVIAWKDLLKTVDPIIKAVTYIESQWGTPDNRSPYLAGLYLDAVPGSGYGTPGVTTSLITYLYQEAQPTSIGYYWTYKADDNVWWRALGGDTEITALALKGLVLNDAAVSMPVVRGALHWLLKRQSWYGWGNTADTAAAISSIIAISQSPISSDADTVVNLVINGQQIKNFSLSLSTYSSFYLDLESYLLEGENTLQLVKLSGSGNVSYYFHGTQVLRSIPVIEVPPKVSSSVGAVGTIIIDLTPSSSFVLATDIQIIPLPGGLTPLSPLVQKITLLTDPSQVTFTFQAPSQAGEYKIPGFEIQYQLTDPLQSVLSPGIISRHHGPIQLSVLESSNSFLAYASNPSHSEPPSSPNKFHLQQKQASELQLTREYSTIGKTRRGDLITVTLTISNNKGRENFLILTDVLPVGYSIDESTIQHPQVTYTRTETGIAFFFPTLEVGSTIVTYGLITNNPRQSLAPPAELASMYDEWIVKSDSAVLGTSRIIIDPVTNGILQDLQYPILEDLTIKEVIHGSSPAIRIAVKASDNWGVTSVRIYVGIPHRDNWVVLEGEEKSDVWTVISSDLEEGQNHFYVEIMDEAGNVLISDSISRYIEFGDLVIPFFSIAVLILMALVAGLGVSAFVKRKNRWT